MKKDNKLLLVDDEEDFLEIMAKFLSRRNIGFETASGCLEALDQLGHCNFDVVIMDVSMPGLDGFSCMAEMKKIQPKLEVIILTGHASPNIGLSGIKKGAFDYCLKPVEFPELLEKIALAREQTHRHE